MIDQILFAAAFFILGAVSGVLVHNLWLNRHKSNENPTIDLQQPSEPVKSSSVSSQPDEDIKVEPLTKKQKKALLVENKLPKDMIEEINEILQDLLLSSPLKGKKLKVSADPPFGVAVWVEGVKFTGVDDVPDTNIRKIIKQAIAEWELRVIARSENR